MPYPPVGQRHTGAPGTVIRAVTCALPQPLNRALSGNRRPRGVARLEALVRQRTERRPPRWQARPRVRARLVLLPLLLTPGKSRAPMRKMDTTKNIQ